MAEIDWLIYLDSCYIVSLAMKKPSPIILNLSSNLMVKGERSFICFQNPCGVMDDIKIIGIPACATIYLCCRGKMSMMRKKLLKCPEEP